MGYLVISLICIVLGLILQALPTFWRGLLCGLGLSGALTLLHHRKEIDLSALPALSPNVRAKCDDPNCPLAEAVKTYCNETGLSLTATTTMLKAYLANQRHVDQTLVSYTSSKAKKMIFSLDSIHQMNLLL
jgi:hypothetical protein